MTSLGFGEILVLTLLLLVVVGPERLPGVLRTAGRLYGRARRIAEEFHRAMVLEADRQDRVAARRGREEPPDEP
ncbi:MAG: hypothetical protein JXX28_06105 [Deltaproteobacteria bacterium]|nr:hypothetical protein [Deltaproteobacteria bacterium]